MKGVVVVMTMLHLIQILQYLIVELMVVLVVGQEIILNSIIDLAKKLKQIIIQYRLVQLVLMRLTNHQI